MPQPEPNPPPGFETLSIDEKIEYVESLWDRIAEESTVPIPDARITARSSVNDSPANHSVLVGQSRRGSFAELTGYPSCLVHMTMRDGGFSHVALATWLTLLSACSAGETTRPKGSSVGNVGHAPPSGSRCAPAGDGPTREGFYQEALFAEPTERTPRFDDYTPGSYHVNKLDLVRGLPARAKACGLPLEAVLVVGPVGILWSFHVATLIAEGPNVRVNALVMPHARITGKGTGLVSAAEASALLQRIQSAPLVRRGLPAPLPVDLEKDFAYRLLLAVYDTAPPQYFHAEFNEFTSDPKRDELMDRVNALFGTTKAQTYPPGEREH